MIFYHGTVKAYLPEIMKEGLKPCPEHAWIAKGTGDVKGTSLTPEGDKYVFLTMDERFAAEIAISKAEYLGMKKGQEGSFFYLKKDTDEVVITEPVLLKITVPEAEAKKEFEVDPASQSELGLRYEGVIPPKYISQTDEAKLKAYKQAITELVKETK